MSWRGESNKQWSDQFLPRIKEIIGRTLISASPPEEDMQRNTDLLVLTLGSVRVACRVRRANYFRSYGDEFTIRCGVPSGCKTELHKVVSGWGEYIFYGFAGESPGEIQAWGIGDLYVFRLWFNMFMASHNGLPPGIVQENGDDTSFRAFRWSELPKEFIVASEGIVLSHSPANTVTVEELSDARYLPTLAWPKYQEAGM